MAEAGLDAVHLVLLEGKFALEVGDFGAQFFVHVGQVLVLELKDALALQTALQTRKLTLKRETSWSWEAMAPWKVVIWNLIN